MPVHPLTGANFDEALARAQRPVVVKFFSPSCPACRASKPMFELLAQRNAARAHFGEVNVDDEGELAGRQRIRSIPTFVIYHRGRRVKSAEGFSPQTGPGLEGEIARLG